MNHFPTSEVDSMFAVRSDLVMQVWHREWRIGVSVYERREKDEGTLLPYEEMEVEWGRVEGSCGEVMSLLDRANRREGVSGEILSGLKKTGRILFEQLVPRRSREKLQGASSRNLILYLDEKLVGIPWELLHDGEEFLCRRYAMGRIVSTRQVPAEVSTRHLSVPFEVLVLADPCGDLRGAYREGIGLRNFLDTRREIFQVNFRSHPLEVSFVKKNLRDYDIVHYAGHADFDSPDSTESGWRLSDGRLRASEVLAMGGIQPMPSLVFCNACRSGQGGSGGWRRDTSSGYLG